MAEPGGVSDCEQLSDIERSDLKDLEFKPDRRISELPEDAELVVDDIHIVRQPIFNTSLEKEDRWLYRLANRLHVLTQEDAIASALPFQRGERVDQRTLDETERLLRRKSYLYDARAIPRRVCDGQLDVDVVVRDVWTLNPRLSLIRTGGENEFAIGLSDTNFLGTGKSLALGYEEDEDRKGTLFDYNDPNVFGSRIELDFLRTDSDDGAQTFLDVRRPFFSLDTRYSYGANINDHEFEQGLFLFSEEFAEFQVDRRGAGLFGGLSPGIEGNVTKRWLFGVRYDENRFSTIPDAPAPMPLPEDRRRVYPWIGYQYIESNFETGFNVDRIQRTEDLFLGVSYTARLGLASDAYGADDDRLIVNAEMTSGHRFEGNGDHQRHLLNYGAELDTEWSFTDDRAEDLAFSAFLNYRFHHAENLSFAVQARATYTKRLHADKQLLLGGEEGLRGYPNRYQAGNRRFLISIEERYFSDIYLFQLFRLGGAVFADVGQAWFPNGNNDGEFGVLSDVGFGLRLESTRTRRDRIGHLDIAFPLQDGPEVKGVEVTVTAKRSL